MRTRAEANRQRWAILAFAIAVLVLSFVILRSAYYQLVLTQVLLWAVLSLAWNLLCGYSGYFSFGHAAFWGLGAYTVALGLLYLDLTPWISIQWRRNSPSDTPGLRLIRHTALTRPGLRGPSMIT